MILRPIDPAELESAELAEMVARAATEHLPIAAYVVEDPRLANRVEVLHVPDPPRAAVSAGGRVRWLVVAAGAEGLEAAVGTELEL